MPGVIFDDTVSDAGSAHMGGSRVYFVAYEVLDFGPSARHPSYWDINTWVGLGYYQLGNDLGPGGLITGIGYGDPHWFNTDIGQRVVSPGEVGSDFTSDIAAYIRWTLVPGVSVRLYVLGDT